MKKLVYSLVVTFLMGLSVNAFAQKAAPPATMAYLNTKTAKKVVDEKTAIVTFQLNNITSQAIVDQYKAAFAKNQQVEVVSTKMEKGNMATFSLKMEKVGTIERLQKMFAKIQVASVTVDGVVVPTKDLLTQKKNAVNATKK